MQLPQNIEQIYHDATCLYTKKEVDSALAQMAFHMSVELAEKNPLFLCVVVGGMIPLAHLLLLLDFPLEVDYIHATRYRRRLVGHEVQWQALPDTPLLDRTVVVVDDILDSGITLQAVMDYCYKKQAKRVLSAVLVDKRNARTQGGLNRADYTALHIENHYVFGFGMDYKGYLRNAPGIYAVKE